MKDMAGLLECNSGTRIEVPSIVTDEEIDFYIENGYLVVAGLMESAEIEELRDEAIAIARGVYPHRAIEALPAHWNEEEVLNSFLCVHQPHLISPVIERYVRHPRICGVLSQITAVHLPFWDGSVKCMQSLLFSKPPGFQGQAWHQDEFYIPTRDRSLVGAWIAMDDANVANGCLRVIPGSQRNGYLYPQEPLRDPDEFDFAPESYGFDESAEVPVEVKTGDAVFFNGYLLHRSLRNRSDRYRRAMVNHYCNAWSRLPWFVKEGESVASADRRNIVPVAGIDPYAWMGLEDPIVDVWLRTCKAGDERASRQ